MSLRRRLLTLFAGGLLAVGLSAVAAPGTPSGSDVRTELPADASDKSSLDQGELRPAKAWPACGYCLL